MCSWRVRSGVMRCLGVWRLVMGGLRMGGLGMRRLGMRSSGVRSSGVRSSGVRSSGVRSLWMRRSGMRSLWVRRSGMRSLWMRRSGVRSLWMRRSGVRSLRVYSSGMLTGSRVLTGVGLDHGVRAALIDRVVLVPVISGLPLMRVLRFCCLDTTIARCRFLSGGWSRVNSTWAIKADVVVGISVADHCTVNVGIVDDGRIDVPNRCIILEVIAFPSAAGEARSVIAVAIVDTSVESNVGTPITAVPTIVAVRKSPVTRGPIVSRLGNLHPSAGHPEITVISVGPVAGIPKISFLRTRWLLVNDKGRRRNCDQDRLSEKRGRCAQQTGKQDISGFHQFLYRWVIVPVRPLPPAQWMRIPASFKFFLARGNFTSFFAIPRG